MTHELADTPLDQTLPDSEELYAAGQTALDAALAAGASGAAVSLGSSTGLSLSLRNDALENLEFQRDNDLSVSVWFGKQRGQASTGDLRPESIREVVEAACTIARHTQEDPAAGLPDPDTLATEFGDPQLDHPSPLTAAQAQALARACEQAAFGADPQIRNSEGASLSAHRSRDVLMNSLGFRGQSGGTDYSLSVAVIAGEGEGMQRDYWYERAIDAGVFDAARAIGERAARRTVERLNPRKLGTRRAPVLFPPRLARGLIGHLVGAASGGALYRRASFVLDRLDQTLFPVDVQIIQRPHRPGWIGAGWFDAEGVATAERPFIQQGRLATYLLGSYAARKLGMQSTGNAGGPQSLEVTPTVDGDEAALMRQAGTGLLVTELMGQGVSTSTGDYSRGAAGLWFENGVPVYPVAGITIAGNLLDMYRELTAIGSDVDPTATIRCGSILLGEMTIAGS